MRVERVPMSSRRNLNLTAMNAGEVDIPHEVILSIERILKIEDAPYSDSLETLSSLFTPVRTLNELFPDGRCTSALHSPSMLTGGYHV